MISRGAIEPVWPAAAGWFARAFRGGRAGPSTCEIAGRRPDREAPLPQLRGWKHVDKDRLKGLLAVTATTCTRSMTIEDHLRRRAWETALSAGISMTEVGDWFEDILEKTSSPFERRDGLSFANQSRPATSPVCDPPRQEHERRRLVAVPGRDYRHSGGRRRSPRPSSLCALFLPSPSSLRAAWSA